MSPRHERPIFIYDGDCAFCTSCANFIERRIPTTAKVVPFQWIDLEPLGVTQEQTEQEVKWIAEDGSVAGGPEGIAKLLINAGSFWRFLGYVLDFPPVRWLAGPVYRWVARNRHRMPGGTAACSLPQAERDKLRAKVDSGSPRPPTAQ